VRKKNLKAEKLRNLNFLMKLKDELKRLRLRRNVALRNVNLRNANLRRLPQLKMIGCKKYLTLSKHFFQTKIRKMCLLDLYKN
jgi:hypothetical protein